MHLFIYVVGCVLLGKSHAQSDDLITPYIPVPCEDWTVDYVDTCDDISYTKRSKFVDGTIYQTSWYYPSQTVGIKGKYGINPLFLGFVKSVLMTEDRDEVVTINCESLVPWLACINSISNQNLSIGGEQGICNETTREMLITNEIYAIGFPIFIQLPENEQCMEIMEPHNNVKDIRLPQNTSIKATFIPQNKGMSVGVIVGIVVGSFIVVSGIGLSIRYFKFKPSIQSVDKESFL
jgi:hypothetical protein